MRQRLVVAALGVTLLLQGAGEAVADDAWNPFKQAESPRRSRPAAPPAEREPSFPPPAAADAGPRPWDGAGDGPTADVGIERRPLRDEQPAPWAQPPYAGSRPSPAVGATETVQRGDLQPVLAADGSGFALDRWQGLDPARLQEMIAPLSLPPRSAALADLWRRLWSSDGIASVSATDRDGRPANASLTAVRIEALYRSGMLADLAGLSKEQPSATLDPVAALLMVRTRILMGDTESGCPEVKALQRNQATVPKPLRHEFLLLAALCGTADRDPARAGLAADLLRAEGVDAPFALAALDSLSSSTDVGKHPASKRTSLMEYRFIELTEPKGVMALLPSAEPALLAVLATGAREPATRIVAAEAALAIHAIQPADLAAAYRAAAREGAHLDAHPERAEPALKRARLFASLEAERNPSTRARLIRTLLDEIRRARGPYMPAAAMLGASLDTIPPAPEVSWFAETAVEIALAARKYDRIRPWIDMASADRNGSLQHWMVLADVADPAWRGRRGEDLPAVEQVAVRGRLSADLMHRLVTVLDALDYQIPIPLWEAASRTPQPSTGHLPETGVLTQLQEASGKREHARVVLTALRTLGPDSGETAHIIALGDTIRALKRAGLEPDARCLALESVFASWPRSAHN